MLQVTQVIPSTLKQAVFELALDFTGDGDLPAVHPAIEKLEKTKKITRDLTGYLLYQRLILNLILNYSSFFQLRIPLPN